MNPDVTVAILTFIGAMVMMYVGIRIDLREFKEETKKKEMTNEHE